MDGNFYEKHETDNELPFILHTDVLYGQGTLHAPDKGVVQPRFRVHWHENIELLLVLEGECDVITNGVKIHASVGDIALVNSNMVHQVEASCGYVRYKCLIVDAAFLKAFGVDIQCILFERLICDDDTRELYETVCEIFESDSEYRLLDMKLALLRLSVNLVKKHVDGKFTPESHSNPKAETVKGAIEYMKRHFSEPLTVEALAKAMGFTKYYFCHIFNEVTGSTVINHLNYIRCKNARNLILSGKCNITEAAEQSGFTNMSYFAKIYKNVIGQLPSETKLQAKSR